MARIALVGGSFNPPHVVHQMMAMWLVSTRRAEQVWFVPCFRHPLGKELASFEHRSRMCELACSSLAAKKVVVSRVEEELGGESRTLYTIQHLRKLFPAHRFTLVIGADILDERDSWYRFDAIEELVEVLVVGRSGYDLPRHCHLALPGVSSTEIRRRLRQGEDVSSLVPGAVLDYILDLRLYLGP
jgi:nicotinate-nucleotide adenylyltransferase